MQTKAMRSLLFVPATRPDRIAKALTSKADGVIVDLEDAVDQGSKQEARALLESFLKQQPAGEILVRVNAPDTEAFQADLALCARHAGVVGIMVPKVETRQSLEAAAGCRKPLWPLIETARGLLALPELVAVSGVTRLSFGALDLGVDLGLVPGTAGAGGLLDQCRYQLLLHSRAAGLPAPIESVEPGIHDLAVVEATAKRAREMGFAGMLCIHPKQLSVVNEAFMPEPSEIEWAQRVIEGANDADGAFQLNGRMVDAPVLARARAIMALAEQR